MGWKNEQQNDRKINEKQYRVACIFIFVSREGSIHPIQLKVYVSFQNTFSHVFSISFPWFFTHFSNSCWPLFQLLSSSIARHHCTMMLPSFLTRQTILPLLARIYQKLSRRLLFYPLFIFMPLFHTFFQTSHMTNFCDLYFIPIFYLFYYLFFYIIAYKWSVCTLGSLKWPTAQ